MASCLLTFARRAASAVIAAAMIALLASAVSAPAHAAAPAFPAVVPLPAGQSLTFPTDYGAHPDYKTEWWYVTGWLNTPDGKPLGFQVTFFRSATTHDRANPSQFAPQQRIIGHAALSDPANGKLRSNRIPPMTGFASNELSFSTKWSSAKWLRRNAARCTRRREAPVFRAVRDRVHRRRDHRDERPRVSGRA